jgi:hypothetical protein
MRKRVVDTLVADLEASGLFKRVYKNVVPVWTQVKSFPAVAVIYESEEKELENSSSRSCYYNGIVNVYIYNKQAKNKFEDILTDLIDEVYTIIENNNVLCCEVISSDVARMKREGGLIHPYSVAEVKIVVRYKLTL